MENESLLLWVENGRALAYSESNKFRILNEIKCAFAPQKRSKLAWRSSDYFEQKRIIRASGPFPRRPARLVSEDREKAFCGGVIEGGKEQATVEAQCNGSRFLWRYFEGPNQPKEAVRSATESEEIRAEADGLLNWRFVVDPFR